MTIEPTKPNGNGNGQPSQREAEIASYLAKQRAESEAFAAELAHIKAVDMGNRVKIDELEALLSDAKSRAETAMLVRDQEIARRVEIETLLGSMLALGRAFRIQNAPLVKERETQEDIAVIGGA